MPRMLRALIKLMFGPRPDVQPESLPSAPEPPSRWREAPSRTLVDEVGGGIVLTTTYSTGHHGFVSVVGESKYQDALRALARRVSADGVFIARLVPEADNAHDPNAVAVCVNDNLAKIGYLGRAIAKSYHASLLQLGSTVTCPARLTGADRDALGVVLDFEEVRTALGRPRVSVDQGDMDYAATSEWHRLTRASRQLVVETRALEKSDLAEAVTRNRRALGTLVACRDLAEAKGLTAYGFQINQTDATVIDRLTRCLLAMGQLTEADLELRKFLDQFPHAAT